MKILFLMKMQETRDLNHLHEWSLLNTVETNHGKQLH